VKVAFDDMEKIAQPKNSYFEIFECIFLALTNSINIKRAIDLCVPIGACVNKANILGKSE